MNRRALAIVAISLLVVDPSSQAVQRGPVQTVSVAPTIGAFCNTPIVQIVGSEDGANKGKRFCCNLGTSKWESCEVGQNPGGATLQVQVNKDGLFYADESLEHVPLGPTLITVDTGAPTTYGTGASEGVDPPYPAISVRKGAKTCQYEDLNGNWGVGCVSDADCPGGHCKGPVLFSVAPLEGSDPNQIVLRVGERAQSTGDSKTLGYFSQMYDFKNGPYSQEIQAIYGINGYMGGGYRALAPGIVMGIHGLTFTYPEGGQIGISSGVQGYNSHRGMGRANMPRGGITNQVFGMNANAGAFGGGAVNDHVHNIFSIFAPGPSANSMPRPINLRHCSVTTAYLCGVDGDCPGGETCVLFGRCATCPPGMSCTYSGENCNFDSDCEGVETCEGEFAYGVDNLVGYISEPNVAGNTVVQRAAGAWWGEPLPTLACTLLGNVCTTNAQCTSLVCHTSPVACTTSGDCTASNGGACDRTQTCDRGQIEQPAAMVLSEAENNYARIAILQTGTNSTISHLGYQSSARRWDLDGSVFRFGHPAQNAATIEFVNLGATRTCNLLGDACTGAGMGTCAWVCATNATACTHNTDCPGSEACSRPQRCDVPSSSLERFGFYGPLSAFYASDALYSDRTGSIAVGSCVGGSAVGAWCIDDGPCIGGGTCTGGGSSSEFDFLNTNGSAADTVWKQIHQFGKLYQYGADGVNVSQMRQASDNGGATLFLQKTTRGTCSATAAVCDFTAECPEIQCSTTVATCTGGPGQGTCPGGETCNRAQSCNFGGNSDLLDLYSANRDGIGFTITDGFWQTGYCSVSGEACTRDGAACSGGHVCQETDPINAGVKSADDQVWRLLSNGAEDLAITSDPGDLPAFTALLLDNRTGELTISTLGTCNTIDSVSGKLVCGIDEGGIIIREVDLSPSISPATILEVDQGDGLVLTNPSGSIARFDLVGIPDASVSDTLTSSIFHGSGSSTDAVDLGTAEVAGTLPDGSVSDTLTASIFRGSGSTTDAVDLATAEVAGVLPDANVVDTITASNYVPLAGGVTMTGPLTMNTTAGGSAFFTVNRAGGANGLVLHSTSAVSDSPRILFEGSDSATQVIQESESGGSWRMTYNGNLGLAFRNPSAPGFGTPTLGLFSSNAGTIAPQFGLISTAGTGQEYDFVVNPTSGFYIHNHTASTNPVVISPSDVVSFAVPLADAQVSDTLTASLFVGSGSSSTAVDLGTAEVAGDLPFSKIAQASAASRVVGRGSAGGAGDFEELTLGSGLSIAGTVLSATGSGGTVTGSGTTGKRAAWTSSSAIGNASDPTGCGANLFVTDQDDAGALTCTQPAFSNLSGTATGAQMAATADAGGDTTTWPLLGTGQTGSQAPATDGALTYNATTNTLTTTSTGAGGFEARQNAGTTGLLLHAVDATTSSPKITFEGSDATTQVIQEAETGGSFRTTYNANIATAIRNPTSPAFGTPTLSVFTQTGGTGPQFGIIDNNGTTKEYDFRIRDDLGFQLVDFTRSSAVPLQFSPTTGAADFEVPLVDAEVSDTLTASIFIGSGSTTNAIDLATAEVAGTLPAASVGTGLTDAQVSDTLTASLFVGSGSSTTAVDLATAEVAGDLPFSSLAQASAASKLFGRGSAGGAGDYQEITIGSGLTMTGTTLSSSGGAGVTGSGTTNTLSKWTSSTGLGDSGLTDNGTNLVASGRSGIFVGAAAGWNQYDNASFVKPTGPAQIGLWAGNATASGNEANFALGWKNAKDTSGACGGIADANCRPYFVFQAQYNDTANWQDESFGVIGAALDSEGNGAANSGYLMSITGGGLFTTYFGNVLDDGVGNASFGTVNATSGLPSDFGGGKLTSVGNGTASTDAVNKGQFDAVAAGCTGWTSVMIAPNSTGTQYASVRSNVINATESTAQDTIAPAAITFHHLAVVLSGAPGASKSLQVKLRDTVIGDTSVTCTVSGASATTCTDSTNTRTTSTFAKLDYAITASGTPVVTTMWIAICSRP